MEEEIKEYRYSYEVLFEDKYENLSCGLCRRLFVGSLLMKGNQNFFICEECFQQSFICSRPECNRITAFGWLKNSQVKNNESVSINLLCLQCLWKYEHSQIETLSNIYDFWSSGIVADLIKQEGINKSAIDNLKKLSNERKDLTIEDFINKLIENLQTLNNCIAHALLLRLKILSNNEEDVLPHIFSIKSQLVLVKAIAYFLDYSSFLYKNEEKVKNVISRKFNQINCSDIDAYKIKIYLNPNDYRETLNNVNANLTFSLNLFYFRAALMNIQLQSNDYKLVESYLKYLNYYMNNTSLKCKLVYSLTKTIYNNKNFSLSSRVGEKAITCFLIIFPGEYSKIIDLALIVAESKLKSGKKKGILNLLVLAYNESEKIRDINLQIHSCTLLSEYYNKTDPEKSQRSIEMANYLQSSAHK